MEAAYFSEPLETDYEITRTRNFEIHNLNY